MKMIPNITPGEILLEDFLEPMQLTPYKLAKGTKLDQTRISEIIHGKRAITADTALRFSRFFGNSPEFWINLQTEHDLREKRKELARTLKGIKRFRPLTRKSA
jgi:addiction module HigA family antidote